MEHQKKHPHYPAGKKPKHHHEENNKWGELMSDIILGGQDGIVNTLGVILGIAAASSDFRIILAGGLAGAIAESVSMGAVGYTSELADRDYYFSQLEKESREIDLYPEDEKEEVRELYRKKGFKGELLEQIVQVITADRNVWLATMMQQELNLNPVDLKRPLKAAMLIGFASLIGSLIPILPFVFFYYLGNSPENVQLSMYVVLVLAAVTLFIVGAIKSKITVGKWYRSGTEMAIIGTVSALFGYGVGFLFS